MLDYTVHRVKIIWFESQKCLIAHKVMNERIKICEFSEEDTHLKDEWMYCFDLHVRIDRFCYDNKNNKNT